MKVAVIGGMGFIGHHLVQRFAGSGHEVCIGLAPGRQPQSPPAVPAIGLDSLEHYRALIDGADLIVHAGGRSTPATSRSNPMIEVDENLRSTLLLCQALAGHTKARVVYLSSAGTVYGDIPEGEADESRTPRPLSSYGAGKVAAEAFLHALHASHGIPVCVLRATNVYGPGQTPKAGFALIPWAITAQRQGRPIQIRGEGTSRRDFLYIDDLCDALGNLCRIAWPENFMLLNVGSGVTHSVTEVLDTIERIGGRRILRQQIAESAGDVKRIAVSIRFATQLLGWTPRVGLDRGIESTIRWFDAQGDSARDAPLPPG